MSCEQCIRELRMNRNLTRPLLQNPKEQIPAPKVAMQVDLMLLSGRF